MIQRVTHTMGNMLMMLVLIVTMPVLMLAYPVNAYGIEAIIVYTALMSAWAFMVTSFAVIVSISVRGNVKSNHYHTTLQMGRGFAWA
jgi:hypothetical protein